MIKAGPLDDVIQGPQLFPRAIVVLVLPLFQERWVDQFEFHYEQRVVVRGDPIESLKAASEASMHDDLLA